MYAFNNNKNNNNRLPYICSNDSKLRELMYTGDVFNPQVAKEIGLVSSIY